MTVGSASSVALSTLYGYTRYLAGTINNVSAFTDAQILALLNIAQRKLQAMILTYLKFGLEENATAGSGTGSIALVAGTNSYAFPTGMLTVDRVDINFTGQTNDYHKATYYQQEKIDNALENTTGNQAIIADESNPIFWCYNKKIYIDPVPTIAVTGGLKVWFTSLVTDLSVETDSPVFTDIAHPILCHEAAIDYKTTKGEVAEANNLRAAKKEIENLVLEFYSNRVQTDKPRLTPRVNSYR